MKRASVQVETGFPVLRALQTVVRHSPFIPGDDVACQQARRNRWGIRNPVSRVGTISTITQPSSLRPAHQWLWNRVAQPTLTYNPGVQERKRND